MRPINFFTIFIVCLTLVIFSLQNTEPVAIQIVRDVRVQAPLCVELILAMGVGAIVAWLYSIWTRLQRMLASRQEIRQMRSKDERIQELEQDIERYKAETEQQQLLPGDSQPTETTSAAEILAQ